MSEQAFVDALDGVVEHSPWVAREAYRSYLGDALESAMRAAPTDAQLALVRAHPELATREPLTDESAREQAGLAFEEPQRVLNAAYRDRFGFPLVVFVREHTPESILSWGRERLARSPEQELETAIGEIAKIARARLQERA